MFKPVQQALRILMWQAGWVVLATVAFGLLISRQWAWSVLVGAGIGLISTSYLVLVVVKHVLNVTKPATLFTVLITWLIKVMLVIGLLLIALWSPLLMPLPVILGLGGSLLAYWLSMVVVNTGK
jgi:F0F1-type ATP synthase assembly protein I